MKIRLTTPIINVICSINQFINRSIMIKQASFDYYDDDDLVNLFPLVIIYQVIRSILKFNFFFVKKIEIFQ